MLERASRTIVLADSHKLNTAERYIIGSLGDIDYLVVEDGKIAEVKDSFSGCNYVVL